MSIEDDIRRTHVAGSASTAPAYHSKRDGGRARGAIFLNALKRTISRGRARLAIVSVGARLEQWALEGGDDPAQLRRIAESEPAVAALLIQEARTHQGEPVVDLQSAIKAIGESRATQLVRSVVAVPSSEERQASQVRHVWTHAVYTAVAARAIARKVKEENPDLHFLAALFYNVGELYLVQRLAEYQAMDGAVVGNPFEGTDPREISVELLQSWDFPAEIAQISGCYGGPFTSRGHRIACAARQAALDYGYTYLEHRPDPALMSAACKGLRLDPNLVRSLSARVSAELNELLRSGP